MSFRKSLILAVCFGASLVLAKDTAILLGLSCDPNDSAFGMNFYNWRVGLKNLGWNSEVFCGPPTEGRYSSHRALQEGSILDLLEEREKNTASGDNFFVMINDHGHEKKSGEKGQQLTAYDDTGESCPLMPMREIAEVLESIDAKNGEGQVWVLNSSCHSGAFLDDLSENSGLCVATNAGTWSQSFQEDFVEIIGWNLAAAKGEAKQFDYLKSDPGRLAQLYTSYRMKELLSQALLKDKLTIAMYTHGMGLDRLNQDSYEAFRAALGPSIDQRAEADLRMQRNKDTQYLERRARGEESNYFVKFPAREARSRLMSEAIVQSMGSCATFNLDRRAMVP